MKIAVCDSDVAVCEDIRNLIVQQKPEAQVAVFSSAEELLGAGADFHIYFLDIKGISGMELAHAIRKRQEEEGNLRKSGICSRRASEIDWALLCAHG